MKLKLLFFPLSIIIALLVFVYFIKPLWNDYSESKKSAAAETVDLERIRNNKENLNRVLTTYKQVNANDKYLLENAIPESPMEEGFLKELNDMSANSGAKISSIELNKTEKSTKDGVEEEISDNNVEEVDTSLSLIGDYFNLKRALYLIENLNRFVRINGFSIKGSDTLNDLALDLDMTFFYKENNNKLKFSLENNYLDSLLKNGLETEVINNYMSYREKVVDFRSIGSGDKGKDNLFDVSGGADLEVVDIEGEIVSEESVTLDSETNPN